LKIIAIALLAFGTAVSCFARPEPCSTVSVLIGCREAPEIDMGTIGAASAFAGCVLMMARGRRKNSNSGLQR
jgi:hypothetical protein